MGYTSLEIWESKLEKVFEEIDFFLEEKYGAKYPLHPARPPRGTTSSHAHDGLFSIGASFTPGFGSKLGRGYALEVRMVTLAKVPVGIKNKMEELVVEMLKEKLPESFPGKNLQVSRDGNIFKITGDLSLGSL
ncbi:MAG: hypothetical protein GX811_00270 [Lentisphaerae bacterium]|nr:hypothetical protein [Lentisphaerota bacterium]